MATVSVILLAVPFLQSQIRNAETEVHAREELPVAIQLNQRCATLKRSVVNSFRLAAYSGKLVRSTGVGHRRGNSIYTLYEMAIARASQYDVASIG